MLVTYARAFNTSKGDPPLPAAPTKGLSQSQRATHKWALDARDTVAAHVDRGAAGRRLFLGEIQTPDGTPHYDLLGETAGLFEVRREASQQQLEELAQLAEHLAATYRQTLDTEVGSAWPWDSTNRSA